MPNLEEIVREEVRRVLSEFLAKERASAAASCLATSQTLAIVFSGTRWPADALWDQLRELVARGYRGEVVVSRTFAELFGQRLAGTHLPGLALQPRLRSESELLELAKRADACVAAALSPTAAAKLTLGISDSIPSATLRAFLELAKPVIVAEDSASLRLNAVAQGAPPKLRRLAEDAYHGLAEMGVSFSPPQDLMKAVERAFFVPVNETPERLARVRPTKQRIFVTSEDVWKASTQGLKELIIPADAVVTDEARDHAQRVGLTILRQD